MTLLAKMLSTAWEKSMEVVILAPGQTPALLGTEITHPASQIPVDASMIERLAGEMDLDGNSPAEFPPVP